MYVKFYVNLSSVTNLSQSCLCITEHTFIVFEYLITALYIILLLSMLYSEKGRLWNVKLLHATCEILLKQDNLQYKYSIILCTVK